MAKTPTGKSVQKYITDVLGTSRDAGAAAIAAGYPDQSAYTEAYLAGVPYLYQYVDAEQAQALGRMGDLYGAYGEAGGYNKTNFADIEGLYGAAGQYAPTAYGDIEAQYSGIGAYTPTQYGDIADQYRATLGYDPREYGMSDYTTQNIQSRMTPYEELVSQRAAARLKKGYDEARGEREAQAARQGAFGGSGAAIQEEVARRNYLEQMEDMNAKNLQAAYESGAGLYGREMTENLAAGQAEEASRQFGQNAQMAGLEGLMSTRNAEEQALEFQKKLQLDVMSGKITSRQAEEASRQFGKQAEFDALSGQMGARRETAAQEAAAKEAQFEALRGQGTAAQQQATLAEQKKNMQLANLASMQQAGQQQQNEQLARQEYPLDIAAQQANMLSPLGGSAIQTKANKPSTAQNILGGLTAAAGVAEGISGIFRSGGIVYSNGGYVYRGGGLADLEPQYYTGYEY
jgi:hypothetical protein